MWVHYCEIEKTKMSVGKGEVCNWCGKSEEVTKKDNIIRVAFCDKNESNPRIFFNAG